jgi:hypothetical protein
VTAPTRLTAILAVAVLALHLPYLPVSLEDLDSINFALGVRHFDVAQHQPHPPGYPLFMFLAKAVNAFSGSEGQALSRLSMISAVIAVLALAALFRAWTPIAAGWQADFSLLLACTSPLFWMTAARPLSDMAGLAATITVQAMAVTAGSVGALGAAALAAALAAGVRSQVVWLTVPVLVLAVLKHPREQRRRAVFITVVAYAVGGLMWGIPLVALSGGPAAYLRALANQGTEDFTGVAMLLTTPSPRQLARALYYALLAPWAAWPLGLAVLAAAGCGLVAMMRRERPTLIWLIVAFGPYFLFDLFFQEMVTTRYALPLVVPAAYLAVRGFALLPRPISMSLAVGTAAASLLLAQPALAAYARTPAPAFRLLADMRATSASAVTGPRPVLAMHRREELDLRRPAVWTGGLPPFTEHLPAPPKHEWLELVKYWNRGGRAPIWFVADPARSDLALVDRHAVARRGTYRWLFAQTDLIGGVRPNVMDWDLIQAPGWYLGEGWSLTPETAGVARDEGRGPGRAPIQGWIRRRSDAVTLMIGGRNLAAADGPPVPIVVMLEDRTIHQLKPSPGFFLEFLNLEPGRLIGAGDYATLAVKAGGNDIAIEQFDVQAMGQIVYGFGDGWYELEYNPATGNLWRWTSERALIRLHTAPQPLTLRLRGTFETAASTAHIVVRAGDRIVAEHDVPRDFAVDIPVAADLIAGQGETVLAIETDQWYVPAERNWRPTRDRRHLGLRISTCEIAPAS